MKNIKLAPSILSADFGRLKEQIDEIIEAGVDYIHVDVMDGHFVPNITVGIPVLASLRTCTALPLDVHLMIENPADYIEQFTDAGADVLTVHIEADIHIHRTLQSIKENKVKAGIALNPSTPVSLIEEILPYADLVLIMTVNPGFGGQTFIEGSIGKINRLRNILDSNKYTAELEVDGGITTSTAPRVVEAGATLLVAGAAIFSDGSPREAIRRMRQSIELAC